MLQGCYSDVTIVFHECYRSLTECYRVVKGLLYGCNERVTNIFQGYFKGVVCVLLGVKEVIDTGVF